MTISDLADFLDPEAGGDHLAAILGEVARRSRADNAVAPAPSKVCSRCAKEKPTSSFARDRNRKDGLQPSCRVCHAAQRSM